MALKISTYLKRFPHAGRRELRIYEHLSKVNKAHPGRSLIRDLYEAFEIPGPHAIHQCLVQPPMHRSVADMMEMYHEPLNAPVLKLVLKRLLAALDFLHTEADVIHTGMRALLSDVHRWLIPVLRSQS